MLGLLEFETNIANICANNWWAGIDIYLFTIAAARWQL